MNNQTKTQQLSSTSTTATADKPQIFTVWSSEIEGRIDPSFYRPEFKILEKAFIDGKYQVKTLKDIAEKISSGATPLSGGDAYTNKEEGIPFIRSGDINADKNINFDDLLYIKEDIHQKKLKSSQLKKGDVLIAIVGATIGQVSLYDYDREANINQAIAMVRVNKGINPEYVKEYLLSTVGQNQLNKIKRPVARANINLEEVGSIKIPLPPLSIQNKIVEIMAKAYQEKKEKEAEAARLLESIDTYVLDQLGIPAFAKASAGKKMCFEVMSGKVENNRVDAEYWQPFLENIEQIIRQSKHRTKKLKDFITKIHYGASTSNAYVDNGIPLLRILNLKPNYVDLSDVVHLPENFRKELGNAFVKAGDLLISRSGTVGIVSVVPKEADGFAFGSFMIKFCLNDEINKEFISIWLNNKLNKLLTKREKIGAIQGNITIGTIENFDIPMPPLSIQNKIVEKINFYYFQAQKLKDEANNNLQKAKVKVERIILG
ncbi:MAG: restriction endonuclease subunit S [Patescibacteria group bacterium]|nr:restriction endonuclease subunit S [Patescibacteria group bacterium]